MDIRFTIPAFPTVLILLAVWLFIWIPFTPAARRRLSPQQLFWRAVLSVYLSGICYFVFLPIDVNIGMYASHNSWYSSIQWLPLLTADLHSFALNIVLTIPFGFLWPLAVNREFSLKQAAIHAFWLSLAIEAIQLLITLTLGSSRSTDINDLIANTAGGVVGARVLKEICKQRIGRKWLRASP